MLKIHHTVFLIAKILKLINMCHIFTMKIRIVRLILLSDSNINNNSISHIGSTNSVPIWGCENMREQKRTYVQCVEIIIAMKQEDSQFSCNICIFLQYCCNTQQYYCNVLCENLFFRCLIPLILIFSRQINRHVFSIKYFIYLFMYTGCQEFKMKMSVRTY